MTPRLKERYHAELQAKLKEELGLENIMQVPRLSKISVNMGLGDALGDSKIIEGAVKDLSVITGQAPQVNRARKSIANFKLREGNAVGVSVTLRGDRFCLPLRSGDSAKVPGIVHDRSTTGATLYYTTDGMPPVDANGTPTATARMTKMKKTASFM